MIQLVSEIETVQAELVLYLQSMGLSLPLQPAAPGNEVKSVQSTLSHLQSPPDWMQSQRNYGSFLSKSDLHGRILYTMLAQNCPKGKRQWLN